MTYTDTGKRADSWGGVYGHPSRCPVPGCGHVGALITKAHCRIHHDMEQHQIEQLYGKPYIVKNLPGKGGDW